MSDDFSIMRPDGSSRRIKGYRAGSTAGQKKYGTGRFSEKELPGRVDLRTQMTPVEDQGDTNSCTANAVAGAYEYLLKRHLGEDAYDVSRMFLYYNARSMDEEGIEDEGSIIGLAVKSLEEYGICSEETWPFDEDKVNEEPDEDAYEEAADFLIEDYSVVPTELYAWKHCLAEGYPIIFGLMLYNSFDNQRRRGLVPHPTQKESSRDSHAGHAMLCVGYSDKEQVFIVRNSWGAGWGDSGYCYIPYRYVMNEKYNFGDSWQIRRLDELAYEDAWQEDETPLLAELETELAGMSDEDYEDMLDDMDPVPPETRIALILLRAAGADGEVSEEEEEEIAPYLEDLLEEFGSDLSARKVLRFCRKYEDDDRLLAESIGLLSDHLSKSALAGILTDVEAVIGTDEISEDEAEFLDRLISAWQIEQEYEEDDEEDDEDEEEDDEDDEDEYGDYDDDEDEENDEEDADDDEEEER